MGRGFVQVPATYGQWDYKPTTEAFRVSQEWLDEPLPDESKEARLARLVLPPFVQLMLGEGQHYRPTKAVVADMHNPGQTVAIDVSALTADIYLAKTRGQLVAATKEFLFKASIHEVYEWMRVDGRLVWDAHDVLWQAFAKVEGFARAMGEQTRFIQPPSVWLPPAAPATKGPEPKASVRIERLPAGAGYTGREQEQADYLLELLEAQREWKALASGTN